MKPGFWKWYLRKLKPSTGLNPISILTDTFTEFIVGAVTAVAGFMSGVITGAEIHPLFLLLLLLIPVGITLIYHSHYRDEEDV